MDAEAKKIRLWAENGDRKDPDAPDLAPPIDRLIGWPASFSEEDGDTPRRGVMNQIQREFSGFAVETMEAGVLEWDAEINYRQYAMVQRNGLLVRASVATGPDAGNVTDPATPGQAVWETVGGSEVAPAKPDTPVAEVGNGELIWTWPCPLDGGSIILDFAVEWRRAGVQAWTPVTVKTPRYRLTGLVNGATYELRVLARNAIGNGPQSDIGAGTPQGLAPGGGNSLALRGEAGNGQVSLSWLQPDTGGLNILDYTVQWRTGQQAYSAGRQKVVNGTSTTVTGLPNGTAQFFRVRARNIKGSGPVSNEVTETPEAPPPPPPADTVPAMPSLPTYTSRRPYVVDARLALPASNGGQRISAFELQWRYQGNAWVGNLLSNTSGCFTINAADASRAVQLRGRVRNSVGVSRWSQTLTVPTAALLAPPTQRHRFNADQNFAWPYTELERAVAVLRGSTGASFSATVQLSNPLVANTLVRWTPSVRPSLGSALSQDGSTTLYLAVLGLFRSGAQRGQIFMQLASSQSQSPTEAGPDFSNQVKTQGSIVIRASDGRSLTVTGISDRTEPYTWTPTNLEELVSFANHVAGLGNKTVSVTVSDGSTSEPTTLKVDGVTYTTLGDDDGVVVQQLSGLSSGDVLAVDIGTNGMVDVFPQF